MLYNTNVHPLFPQNSTDFYVTLTGHPIPGLVSKHLWIPTSLWFHLEILLALEKPAVYTGPGRDRALSGGGSTLNA